MTMNDLNLIGDTLVDQDLIREYYSPEGGTLTESFESYKRANSLLGYFSQLRDYQIEYDRLQTKVLEHRREILSKYKHLLTHEHQDICKQLLIPPSSTPWYSQGIHKYKKVKNYSVYYYRRKLYIVLEQESINTKVLRKLIDTIISVDKYYEIYDDTIAHFMKISDRFEQIMRKHFSDSIHL